MSLFKFAWILLALVRPKSGIAPPLSRAACRRALASKLSPHLLKDVGLHDD